MISLRTTLLLAAFILPGCFFPPSTNTGGRNGTNQPINSKNWVIGLTRLRVDNAQEDRQLASFSISNGDEPYLILIGFKGEFGELNSGRLTTNQYRDDEWAENIRAGQSVNIPIEMGVFEFRGIQPNSVIGILALAMESDRTPWAIIEERVAQVVQNLETVVNNEIEGRTDPDLSSTAFIDNLHQAMVETVMPLSTSLSAGAAIENIIFSGIDTDELIGVNSIVFMPQRPSSDLEFPYYSRPYFTDVLGNTNYTLGGRPLIFSNASLEAQYRVEMRVREF